MAGGCLLHAGNLSQTLSVIVKKTLVDELKACLKESYTLHCVEVRLLTTTMRVHLRDDKPLGKFSSQLINIGVRNLPVNIEIISLSVNWGFIVDEKDILLQISLQYS